MPPRLPARLRLIENHWHDKLRGIFSEAESALVHDTPDVILLLIGGAALSDDDEPIIDHVTRDKLMLRLGSRLDGESVPARILLINITRQLALFHDALVDVHLLPEPRVAAMTKRKSKRAPKQPRRAKVTA